MTDQPTPINGSPEGTPPAPPAPNGATPPWFSEGNKPIVEAKGWKTGDDAIGAYSNLEKLMGAEKAGRTVLLPKDEKDVEGIKAFRAKLGVPESADKYDIPVPQGQGGGDLAKAASQWFLDAGVPREAARAITEKWNTHIESLIKADADAYSKKASEELGTLKGEWGNQFDANREYAERYAKEAGWTPEEVKAIQDSVGTARFLKMFATQGRAMGEPEPAGGGSNVNASAKAQLEQQISDLRTKRVANQITEKQFFEQMEVLGPKLAAI